MDTHPKLLLEHRKSTTAEGRRVLAGTLFTMAVFVAFGAIALFNVSLEAWAIALASINLTAFTLAVMLYAVPNIRARDEFSCRLDRERFTCVSPVDACGDNFDLALNQIVKIERRIGPKETAAGTCGTPRGSGTG